MKESNKGILRMLNSYGRENNCKELVAQSLVRKPCGKLRIKGNQSNSSQLVKANELSYVFTSNGPCTTSCLGREQEEKQRQHWGCSVHFSSFYKKITEMHLNQIPQPPWRCLQLIWSVDAVSFCVTHFLSPCGNGCTVSCTPGHHSFIIFPKTGSNKLHGLHLEAVTWV